MIKQFSSFGTEELGYQNLAHLPPVIAIGGESNVQIVIGQSLGGLEDCTRTTYVILSFEDLFGHGRGRDDKKRFRTNIE